jgi:GntR family transcriptional repressor for pyruvate dehydrogenase complex
MRASTPPGRPTRVDEVVDRLLERILSGEIAADDALPPEADIAVASDVSRLTAREAIKVLQAQNIVHVKRGVGTFVNPPGRWTGLDSIVRATARGIGSGELALRLLEARRIVETGAAELAALRHSGEDLVAMAASISGMELARDSADVLAFAESDITFHDQVLAASGNPFIPALLGSLTNVLYTARSETSSFPDIQLHAIQQHRLVLAAIASGSPAESRSAMEAHITQTYEDYERYLSISEDRSRSRSRGAPA